MTGESHEPEAAQSPSRWADMRSHLLPTVQFLQIWTAMVVGYCCIHVTAEDAVQLVMMFGANILSVMEDLTENAAGRSGEFRPNIALIAIVVGLIVVGTTHAFGDKVPHIPDVISMLILSVATTTKKLVAGQR
ncbi:MAG: hypothetical protein OXC11_03535 [Rhodospirillales bacterium]|nr:hypothetical protein [Rhodospirillales bacterium]